VIFQFLGAEQNMPFFTLVEDAIEHDAVELGAFFESRQ